LTLLTIMAKIGNICHNLSRGDNYGNHERFIARSHERMG
jgi:hypothetical protein